VLCIELSVFARIWIKDYLYSEVVYSALKSLTQDELMHKTRSPFVYLLWKGLSSIQKFVKINFFIQLTIYKSWLGGLGAPRPDVYLLVFFFNFGKNWRIIVINIRNVNFTDCNSDYSKLLLRIDEIDKLLTFMLL
jgi:hypothetical protein